MQLLSLILLAVVSLTDDLQLLDTELSRADQYNAAHEHHIDSLRSAALAGDTTFDTYLQLYECYASYHFDSAYVYACRLEEAAKRESLDCQVLAAVKKSFVYFSAGLFKESHDALASIDSIEYCSPHVRATYYSTYARLLLDLGTYVSGALYDTYTARGIHMLDEQIACLTPADTYDYYYAQALRAMKKDDHTHAIRHFETCLLDPGITDHQQAIAYSSMAYSAHMLGDEDLALHYMILAAIYDIRSSTNEAVALRFVASMLHDRGQSDAAMHYITLAKQNADRYGARHRQMEVSQILPIIEHDNQQRKHQYRLTMWIILTIALFIVLIALTFSIFAYRQVQRKNRALSKAHDSINQMNNQLAELGKIKEEYIGNFLAMQSDTIHAIDTTLTHLSRLSREQDMKGIVAYINAIPRQNRRAEFMQQFDRMFLRICPDFVDEFNALMQPEFRIQPKEGELLTTELRIFALMRLGITANEKIAQVLDYSVNTVYTYKTKMRSRSILNSDAFYEAVLHIAQ